jgi:hypothetical protein
LETNAKCEWNEGKEDWHAAAVLVSEPGAGWTSDDEADEVCTVDEARPFTSRVTHESVPLRERLKRVEQTTVISNGRLCYSSSARAAVMMVHSHARKQTRPRIKPLSFARWFCLYQGVVGFGRTAMMPPMEGWDVLSTAMAPKYKVVS